MDVIEQRTVGPTLGKAATGLVPLGPAVAILVATVPGVRLGAHVSRRLEYMSPSVKASLDALRMNAGGKNEEVMLSRRGP